MAAQSSTADRGARAAALRVALWSGLSLLLVLLAADAAFYLVALGSQRDQLAELSGTPLGDAAVRAYSRSLFVGIVASNVPILVAAAAAAYALGRMAVAPLAQSLELQRRFAAQASHELRTPIAVIAAEAEVALRDGRPEEAAPALERVLEEARRMARLAGDLLTLARPASGVSVASEPVDLQDVVATTVRRFTGQAQARGVGLRREEGAFTLVTGDRERLLELVGNLVSNALRATPPGGAIEIAARPARGEATLEVRDSGSGIPRERLAEIFEPFVSLSVNGEAGAGLGLAICRWIAAAHRGSIEVRSEAGCGSVFTLRLPIRTA
ncbi:HAMP domain-containing histidine kinase [bacterium]|nr:MAG: HAMP domain-containing histidine kinase [bacterium]